MEEVYPRFDGIPAYVYRAGESSFDHLPGELQERDGDLVLNKIGWYEDPRVEKIDGKTNIVADLHIHEGAESVRKFFKEAWDKGKRLGVSIVADGYAQLKRIKDSWYAVLEGLVPRSVDPVTNPATGARFLKLIETEVDSVDLTEGLIELAEGLGPALLEEYEIEEGEEGLRLDRDAQLELVDGLIESLEPESFPEELLGNQLRRLREAVFTEQEEKAEAVIGEVLGKKAAEVSAGGEESGPAEEAVSEAVEKLDKVLSKVEEAVAVGDEPEGDPDSEVGAESLEELKRLLQEGDLEEALALLDELMPEEEGEGDERMDELAEKINSLERTRAEVLGLIASEEADEETVDRVGMILPGDWAETSEEVEEGPLPITAEDYGELTVDEVKKMVTGEGLERAAVKSLELERPAEEQRVTLLRWLDEEAEG